MRWHDAMSHSGAIIKRDIVLYIFIFYFIFITTYENYNIQFKVLCEITCYKKEIKETNSDTIEKILKLTNEFLELTNKELTRATL